MDISRSFSVFVHLSLQIIPEVENYELNANDFLDLLINDVEIFRGETPPHDDTTALVFKREV
jgi:hypothetical protein